MTRAALPCLVALALGCLASPNPSGSDGPGEGDPAHLEFMGLDVRNSPKSAGNDLVALTVGEGRSSITNVRVGSTDVLYTGDAVDERFAGIKYFQDISGITTYSTDYGEGLANPTYTGQESDNAIAARFPIQWQLPNFTRLPGLGGFDQYTVHWNGRIFGDHELTTIDPTAPTAWLLSYFAIDRDLVNEVWLFDIETGQYTTITPISDDFIFYPNSWLDTDSASDILCVDGDDFSLGWTSIIRARPSGYGDAQGVRVTQNKDSEGRNATITLQSDWMRGETLIADDHQQWVYLHTSTVDCKSSDFAAAAQAFLGYGILEIDGDDSGGYFMRGDGMFDLTGQTLTTNTVLYWRAYEDYPGNTLFPIPGATVRLPSGTAISGVCSGGIALEEGNEFVAQGDAAEVTLLLNVPIAAGERYELLGPGEGCTASAP